MNSPMIGMKSGSVKCEMARQTLDAKAVRKKAKQFRLWLSANGAEVLDPTNQYELVRFVAGNHTSIIYRKENGGVTFTNQSKTAWTAFTTGKAWRACKPTPRRQVSAKVSTLMRRDGKCCFFCCNPLGDDVTVEHLVPITHGGPNHISNLFLAHYKCNEEAGRLSAVEKVKIHVAAKLRKESGTCCEEEYYC